MGNCFRIVMSRVGLTVLHKFISPFLKRKDNHRLWNCLHLDLKTWAHRLNLIFPQSDRGHAEPMQPPRVSRSVCVCVWGKKKRVCLRRRTECFDRGLCMCVSWSARARWHCRNPAIWVFTHEKKKLSDRTREEGGREMTERAWREKRSERK